MSSTPLSEYLKRSIHKESPFLFFKDRLGVIFPRKPAEILGQSYAPGIREYVFDVCSGAVRNAIALGPRGGGKTYADACIEAYFWEVHDYDWVNLGGSQIQASKCFGYISEFVRELGHTEKTLDSLIQSLIQKSDKGAFISVLAASETQVRGPHVGGVNRGGGRVLDEEAVMKPQTVRSARYITTTANPAIHLHSSTFHEISSTYADLWDNAEGKGYKRYQWDIFDVAQKCDQDCSQCIPEFAEAIWGVDEKGNKKLVRSAYCGGKAKVAEGWIAIENIKQAWRDANSRDEFEVEMMGERPSASAYVIRDREALQAVWINEDRYFELVNSIIYDSRGFIGVDWGFKGECVVLAIKQISDQKWLLVDYEFLHRKGDLVVRRVVEEMCAKWGIHEVNGDSENPYANHTISESEMGLNVLEVAFNAKKKLGVGKINGLIERGEFLAPGFDLEEKKFSKFRKQLEGWRKDENGQIVKRDDHGPDALICAVTRLASESPQWDPHPQEIRDILDLISVCPDSIFGGEGAGIF